ncbi:MAG: hypothetical protein IPK24_10810 [Kineosporiaceae bacterium]|nr:hypothetical protein [Kineosporiaceae bacterium]MBK8076041.1 hypothetical protein [Kineosporiaceae bacterium]
MISFEDRLPASLAETAERMPGLDRVDPDRAARQILGNARRRRLRRRIIGAASALTATALATAVAVAVFASGPGTTRTTPEPMLPAPATSPSPVTGWLATLPRLSDDPGMWVLSGSPPQLTLRGRSVEAPEGLETVSSMHVTPHGLLMVGFIRPGTPDERTLLLLLSSAGPLQTAFAPQHAEVVALNAVSADGGSAYFTLIPRTARPDQVRYGVLELVTGSVTLHEPPTEVPVADGQLWGPAGLISISMNRSPRGVTIWRPEGPRRFVPLPAIGGTAAQWPSIIAEDGTAVLITTTHPSAITQTAPGRACFAVLDVTDLTTSDPVLCGTAAELQDVAIGPGGGWLLDGVIPIEVATGRRGDRLVPKGQQLADRWAWQDATTVRNRLVSGGTVQCTVTDSRCSQVTFDTWTPPS